MRKLLIAVSLLLVLGAASAEWAERLRVQAVDNYMNPLSGVFVEVTYQKQMSSGTDGKEVGKTNGDGIFEVYLRNSVSQYGGDENRVYTIAVTNPYSLPAETRKVKYGDNPIGGAHLEQFQYNTTAARLRVVVQDQKHKPVANASVVVGPVSAVTDDAGVAKLGLVLGGYSVVASKDGFSASETIKLESDSEIDLMLLIYENTLRVIVANEYGVPLQGVNVSFSGVDLETNVSGEAKFVGLRVSKGTLVGEYEGVERSAEVEFIEENVTKTLVFPSTPLLIDKISVQTQDPYEENCTVIIGCRARDERVALSKISVTLLYSKNNGAEWNSLTQKNELGVFEFDIPCTAPMDLSYTMTASNEYGSAQTPTYNMSVPAPVVCDENQTKECATIESCPGVQPCVSGSWGECADVIDDGCPVTGGPGPNDNRSGPANPWDIKLPEGMGAALVAFIMVGSIALIGGVGILLITQRDKVSGIFDALKKGIGVLKNADKIIEKADKEYQRDKLSEKYMKDGNTDDFFGLNKEDKLKPQAPRQEPGDPPQKPPEKPPEQ